MRARIRDSRHRYEKSAPCTPRPALAQRYVSVSATVSGLSAKAPPTTSGSSATNSQAPPRGSDQTLHNAVQIPDRRCPKTPREYHQTAAKLNGSGEPVRRQGRRMRVRIRYAPICLRSERPVLALCPAKGTDLSPGVGRDLGTAARHAPTTSGSSPSNVRTAQARAPTPDFVTARRSADARDRRLPRAIGTRLGDPDRGRAPKRRGAHHVPVRIRDLRRGDPRSLRAVLVAAHGHRRRRLRVGLGQRARRRDDLPLPARGVGRGRHLLRSHAHLHDRGDQTGRRGTRTTD